MKKLKVNPEWAYSDMEQALFALLGKRPRTTTDIAEAYYARTAAPINARGSVLSVMRSLQRKAALNREPFLIKDNGRQGPTPMWFWLEEKPR